MANRLASETSPYLLQHQHNPVDWYPWGPEALQRARDEDRPIFLSIGYSACHWCHVMERESFENEDIAALMNDRYVCIKVDREERPDIDAIYMQAVQAMTGHGGWPMSMFLTPELKPFYAGTYYPPEDRQGMPAFPRVLEAVSDAFRNRRDEVEESTGQIMERLEAVTAPQGSDRPLDAAAFGRAYQALTSGFDGELGGLGSAPKFPQPLTWEFVLRYWWESGDAAAMQQLQVTLVRMARGGMYDQVGGGFHRYSVDRLWLVPHFEKMLYDNALLATLYLHAYQAIGDPFLRDVVEETLAYVEREMRHPGGGFYSAQDADSEGVEGKFFVWTPQEIDEVLGADLGRVARLYWGVTDEGNFEERNILWAPNADTAVAEELGMSVDDLRAAIAQAKGKLYAAREQRVHPGLDDKVLTAWNGLMLKAFAEAGALLRKPHYVQVARENAEFLLSKMVNPEGRLLRTWRNEGEARLNGYLEDYAMLGDGLLALYEATFERRWLDEAVRLADQMVELFWDANEGIFFDTGSDHEALVLRPRDIFDNAMPSGGSVAANFLLRLATFTGRSSYEARAVTSIRSVAGLFEQAPSGFANWLAALHYHAGAPKELVVIGDSSLPATQELLRAAREPYLPNRVIAGAAEPEPKSSLPLLEGKTLVDGQPTAFLCESYACQAPVTTAEALTEQIGAARAG